MKRYSLITLFAALLVLTPASSAFAVLDYTGVGGRPAYPRPDNPRTDSIFVHTIEPGESVAEGVRVINNTTEKKTLLVYSADYTPSSDGGFACKQFVEEKKEVGSWITLAKDEVTLEPYTNELVPFTIDVPEDAAVGEHDGCILVQEKKAERGDSENKVGINLSFRTGLRVAVTVPGEIKKELEIVGFDILPSDQGAILLNPRLRNIGSVSVDADVQVLTKYFFGKTYAENGGTYAVLRNDVSNFNFKLEKPYWGGLYSSTFTTEYNNDTTLELGQVGEKNVTLTGPTVWFFVAPDSQALGIEVGIITFLFILILIVFISKKRKKWMRKNWVSYTVKKGDDIKSVSKNHHVSWKILAKANKLSAPYILEEGQKIQVPPAKVPKKNT